VVRAFAARGARGGSGKKGPAGLYLDGGFGVGKTHLLAALAWEAGEKAAFGTFVEYTHLVGALGFQPARAALQEFRLVLIDEFELDDPGDTLLMARLMRELADAGVAIAATSNTPPGALGEGRFAADDFRREIQGLSAAFDVVTIDGDDYRHRGDASFPPPVSDEDVHGWAVGDGAACEDFATLVADLRHVHPSRLRAYLAGVTRLGLTQVVALEDQADALRLVTLVDRLYDEDVALNASGESLGTLFSADMLRGGHRKKYLRALSRLAALAGDA